MAGRAGLAVALSVCILLAGCAKGSAEDISPPAGTNTIQGSGEPIADAGSIQGIVVDDTLLPLASAALGLQDIEGVATSNEAGEFSFTNLVPGDYVLHAARLGYGSISSKVVVFANEVTPVQVTLAPIAIPDSVYVELIIEELHMACAEGLVVVTSTGGPCAALYPNKVTSDVNVTGDLMDLVGELAWVANSGLSSREMRLTVGVNESGGNLPAFDEEYDDQTGPSPVVVRKDAPFKGLDDLPEEGSFIRYRIWVPFSTDEPPIIILVLDQRLTLYSSTFYGEKAPAEFSAIPDG